MFPVSTLPYTLDTAVLNTWTPAVFRKIGGIDVGGDGRRWPPKSPARLSGYH